MPCTRDPNHNGPCAHHPSVPEMTVTTTSDGHGSVRLNFSVFKWRDRLFIAWNALRGKPVVIGGVLGK